MKDWTEEEERLQTAESAKFSFCHQSRWDKPARTARVCDRAVLTDCS